MHTLLGVMLYCRKKLGSSRIFVASCCCCFGFNGAARADAMSSIICSLLLSILLPYTRTNSTLKNENQKMYCTYVFMYVCVNVHGVSSNLELESHSKQTELSSSSSHIISWSLISITGGAHCINDGYKCRYDIHTVHLLKSVQRLEIHFT